MSRNRYDHYSRHGQSDARACSNLALMIGSLDDPVRSYELSSYRESLFARL